MQAKNKEEPNMKRQTVLTAAIAGLLVTAALTPAQAEEVGLRLDLGGKLVTRASANGSGIGGGASLSYIFSPTPIGVGIGVKYLTMTNLPTGSTGNIVDVPIEVSYHFVNAAPNLDPYLYIGDDIEIVNAGVTGATTSQTQAGNPSFGTGFRWFFAPQFGVHMTVGGRVALDNGSTFQFVSNIGTSLKF